MSDENKIAYGGIISSTNLGFEFPGNYGFLNDLPIESDREETETKKSFHKKNNRSAISSKESKVTFGDMRYLIACYVNVYVQEEKGEFPQNLLFREISIKDSRLKKYYDCEVRSISPFESHMGYDVMDVYLNDKEEKKNNTNHQVKRKKYKIIGRKNKGQQNK